MGAPVSDELIMKSGKVSLNEVTKFDPYRVVYYEIVAKINSPAPCRIKITNRQDAVDLFVKLLMSSEGL